MLMGVAGLWQLSLVFILEKISLGGIDSLDDRERALLEQATRRRREDR